MQVDVREYRDIGPSNAKGQISIAAVLYQSSAAFHRICTNAAASRSIFIHNIYQKSKTSIVVDLGLISSSPDPPIYPQPPVVSAPLPAPTFVYYTVHPKSALHSPEPTRPTQHHWTESHSPRIRLITIPNHAKQNTPIEPIEPHILPPLILILLPRPHTEQVATWWLVVVFVSVVAGSADCG